MNIIDIARITISGLVGAAITPLIMNLWSKFSPPDEVSQNEKYTFQQLHERNSKINSIASIFAVFGLLLAISLYMLGVSKNNPWPLGLGFGFMVILPVAYISIVTLPKGQNRFTEFWRFYELNYDIGIRSLFVVYVLISILGLFSAYQLILNV